MQSVISHAAVGSLQRHQSNTVSDSSNGIRPEDEVYFPAAKVRARYGISDMTLFRRIRSETLGFPKPVYVGNRRFWRLSELIAWERGRPLSSLSD